MLDMWMPKDAVLWFSRDCTVGTITRILSGHRCLRRSGASGLATPDITELRLARGADTLARCHA
jgi:hypothetical protein